MQTNGQPLDALGDRTRRQVFELLRDGPRSVGELAADLPVSRPAVSQHLRILEEAGLGSSAAAPLVRRVFDGLVGNPPQPVARVTGRD